MPSGVAIFRTGEVRSRSEAVRSTAKTPNVDLLHATNVERSKCHTLLSTIWAASSFISAATLRHQCFLANVRAILCISGLVSPALYNSAKSFRMLAAMGTVERPRFVHLTEEHERMGAVGDEPDEIRRGGEYESSYAWLLRCPLIPQAPSPGFRRRHRRLEDHQSGSVLRKRGFCADSAMAASAVARSGAIHISRKSP